MEVTLDYNWHFPRGPESRLAGERVFSPDLNARGFENRWRGKLPMRLGLE